MKGIRLKTWFVFSLLFVAMASMGAESLFAATDVTDKVQINKSRMRFDRRTSENYLDVSLTNISEDTVLSPIKVVIDSISAGTVSIANADGYTEDGKPYFEYSTANDLFEASETTSSKSWRFSNPRRARFNFCVTVYQGSIGNMRPVTPEEIVTDPESGVEYVIGQLLLTPVAGTSRSEIEQLVENMGGECHRSPEVCGFVSGVIFERHLG